MAFKWLKKSKNKASENEVLDQQTEIESKNTKQTKGNLENAAVSNNGNKNLDHPTKEEEGYFSRLKKGLSKTSNGFANLFLGKKTIEADLLDDIEMQLLTADVGMEVTKTIVDRVSEGISRKDLKDPAAIQTAIKDHMLTLLEPYEVPLDVAAAQPFVILMIGINGAGKTTTIGKLAKYYQNQNKKVMLAAGDTFRAAAVEQLQTWGERNHVPVVAQSTGADSASVAYDALQSAIAKNMDILIIDTAGRLHTQDHLMEELKKIKRVLHKLDANIPHETMLVIDAGNGQNALRQATEFNKTIGISGITVTKLDGTAKGGIIFAVTNQLKLPIRFIGIGEKIDDLRPFNTKNFVSALLYSNERS